MRRSTTDAHRSADARILALSGYGTFFPPHIPSDVYYHNFYDTVNSDHYINMVDDFLKSEPWNRSVISRLDLWSRRKGQGTAHIARSKLRDFFLKSNRFTNRLYIIGLLSRSLGIPQITRIRTEAIRILKDLKTVFSEKILENNSNFVNRVNDIFKRVSMKMVILYSIHNISKCHVIPYLSI